MADIKIDKLKFAGDENNYYIVPSELYDASGNYILTTPTTTKNTTLATVDDLEGISKNTQDGTGTGALNQLKDGDGTTFSFDDANGNSKNPNAYAIDKSIKGNIPYGGVGNYATSFGGKSSAQGKRSLAQGTSTIAKGNYSHAEGDNSVALGIESHAEGYATTAAGLGSHTEGNQTQTKTTKYTVPSGSGSGSGQGGTESGGTGDNWNIEEHRGEFSHAEGINTIASGFVSHSEGSGSVADGHVSHAEGESTLASGRGAKSFGYKTTASGDYSVAGGYASEATALDAVAIGDSIHVEGSNSVAFGIGNQVNGKSSFAAGKDNIIYQYNNAKNGATIGEGLYSYNGTIVLGKYNAQEVDAQNTTRRNVLEIGAGTSITARKNALWVDKNGHVGISEVPTNNTDVVNKKYVDDRAPKDGKLTIQKNGANVATFTANQSGDTIADISVPTKLGDLNERTSDKITEPSNSYNIPTLTFRPYILDTLGNRMYGILPSRVVVERSIDEGKTWSVLSLTDALKNKLFDNRNEAVLSFLKLDNKFTCKSMIRVTCALADFGGAADEASDENKIALWTNENYVDKTIYCNCDRFYVYVGGPNYCDCWIQTAPAPLSGSLPTFTDKIKISNAAGWNGGNTGSVNSAFVLGGNKTQAPLIRFVFRINSRDGQYNDDNLNQLSNDLFIKNIRLFGNTIWGTNSLYSSMITYNTPYYNTSGEPSNYQWQGNLSPDRDGIYNLGDSSKFWNKIYATDFVENGVPLSEKYLKKGDGGNYVPYTGATKDVDLGEHNLTSNNIKATRIISTNKDLSFGDIQDTQEIKGVFSTIEGKIGVGYSFTQTAIQSYFIFDKHDIQCTILDKGYITNTFSMLDVYKMLKTKYYRHSLTLTCGTTATYYIDYYSKNNLVVDSLQDLTTITGGHAFGCGTAQATFTSNVWKIGETAIDSVSDDVAPLADEI